MDKRLSDAYGAPLTSLAYTADHDHNERMEKRVLQLETQGVEVCDRLSRIEARVDTLATRDSVKDLQIAMERGFANVDMLMAKAEAKNVERFAKSEAAIAERFANSEAATADRFVKGEAATGDRFMKSEAATGDRFVKLEASMAQQFAQTHAAMAKGFAEGNAAMLGMTDKLHQEMNAQTWRLVTLGSGCMGAMATAAFYIGRAAARLRTPRRRRLVAWLRLPCEVPGRRARCPSASAEMTSHTGLAPRKAAMVPAVMAMAALTLRLITTCVSPAERERLREHVTLRGVDELR